jgi:hypothetical protein
MARKRPWNTISEWNDPGETVKRLLVLLAAAVLLSPLFAGEWTVLVYMAADNNLWQNAVQDINDMESAVFPAGLEVIVQTDIPAESSHPGGQRRRIRQDYQPYITSPVLANLGDIDSGDPETIRSFVNWGFSHYPSQHRMLVIWGHGDNWFKGDDWKWICPDEGSESIISVSEGELKAALTGIPSLDILLFDACSMQSLEVLAEVMHAADYVVGSEELVPASGFPYQSIIPLFFSDDPAAVAAQIPQEYLESYEAGGIQNPDGFVNPITCSAIRTSTLEAFYTGFRDYFLSPDTYWPISMLPIRLQCWEMNTGYNDIDIGELLDRIFDAWGNLWEPQLSSLIDKWDACVLASGSLNIQHEVGAAAIWFPYNQQYYNTWWTHYADLEFAQYRWFQILHRAYGPHGKPPAPILESYRQVLDTHLIEIRQPAYPDSLWYVVRPRPWFQGDEAVIARPAFGQETFTVSLPHSAHQWVEIESVNPWGWFSDSTHVELAYNEPGLELLIAPNPVKDRSLASARWYLPEGATGEVELSLSNLRGQKVLTRDFSQPEPGEGIWLLSGEEGFAKLGRGVFILTLKFGNKKLSRKLAIL